jgi:two-component system response regulator
MTRTTKPITILMADDDPDDRQMTREAFDASRVVNDLRFVEDGVELMDYLCRRNRYSDPTTSPKPGLILLDLNMPKKDGRQALAEIKADPQLRNIRVVVMTTSKAEEDILRTYDLGASSYVTKPVTFNALVDVIATLGRYWLEIVELPNGEVRGHG